MRPLDAYKELAAMYPFGLADVEPDIARASTAELLEAAGDS